MKRRQIIVLLTIFIMIQTVTAGILIAQPLKIGVFDPVAVLSRMPELNEVEQRIQNLVEEKSAEFNQLQIEFRQSLEEYQQKLGVISEEARGAEEERLGQMELEIQQFQSEAEQEIEEQRLEWLSPLLEKLRQAAGAVAAQKEIDYLVASTLPGDVSAGPLARNVLHISSNNREQFDITEEVIAFMELEEGSE